MRRLFLAAAALGVASTASAQQPAKPVTRSEYMKNVDTRFNTADANHDGAITKQEIIAQQQRDLQQTKARLDQELTMKFRQLDTNHDGQLSLAEFLAIAPPLHPSQTPDQVLQQLDTNHDGKISLEEFRAPEIAKFNKYDLNHDGVVTPDEMKKVNGGK